MDAIEDAMKRNPEITIDHIRSLRLSSDHGGLYPRPDQLARMKKLGMMLSMASQSMSRSYPWIQKYGLEKFQKWVVPVKDAIEAGIKVAWEGEGGYKDGPFSMIAPFLTRKNHQGAQVNPNQALDRNTVIKMATAWGSEFLLKEDKLGSIERGKLADFLILNQDYFSVPLEQVELTYPLMTVLGGKIVFLRTEFAKEIGLAPVGKQVRYNFETGARRSTGEGH
jgi:predicted amidohydrolase YtcJ